jgi:stearoyl-CoA desaturase (Delta-9 desaturase)
MEVLWFFLLHWFLSLFCQTFFLHRYASHAMFSMDKGWERFFYFMTFITQGASFLNPRAYAIMHRMHHAYSDTEKDPHSPHFIKDVWGLMMKTKKIYHDFLKYKTSPPAEFDQKYPTWPLMDRVSDSWMVRIFFGLAYTAVYIYFSPPWYLYLLLPVHYLMGPLHGAIVNWCGHKYGYQNFNNGDHSKNSVPVDVFLMGELMQNNHHKAPSRVNFARRWFEIDPGYLILKLITVMGIIKVKKQSND